MTELAQGGASDPVQALSEEKLAPPTGSPAPSLPVHSVMEDDSEGGDSGPGAISGGERGGGEDGGERGGGEDGEAGGGKGGEVGDGGWGNGDADACEDDQQFSTRTTRVHVQPESALVHTARPSLSSPWLTDGCVVPDQSSWPSFRSRSWTTTLPFLPHACWMARPTPEWLR